MKKNTCKKYLPISIGLLVGLSTWVKAQEVDDVYFSTKDRTYEQGSKYKKADQPAASEEKNTSSESNEVETNENIPRSYYNDDELADANTETEQYDESDDYYDSEYSQRIKRFRREPVSDNYYDERYVDEGQNRAAAERFLQNRAAAVRNCADAVPEW